MGHSIDPAILAEQRRKLMKLDEQAKSEKDSEQPSTQGRKKKWIYLPKSTKSPGRKQLHLGLNLLFYTISDLILVERSSTLKLNQ